MKLVLLSDAMLAALGVTPAPAGGAGAPPSPLPLASFWVDAALHALLRTLRALIGAELSQQIVGPEVRG